MTTILAIVGKKILEKVLDAAIDDAMADIFGKPENPVDLLKQQKEQLDKIVAKLDKIDENIKRLSTHIDDKIDELGLDLKEDFLRKDLDYINSQYIQYMSALKSLNTDTKRSRDTMTARGTEMSLHIYDSLHAIQSALGDGEKPGIITRVHTAVWKKSTCLITYFTAMQIAYRKYAAAQIKGAFLINALYRDPLIPFADGGDLVNDVKKNMDAQINHIRNLTIPEYYDLALQVFQDPSKPVPFQFFWAYTPRDRDYSMTVSKDVMIGHYSPNGDKFFLEAIDPASYANINFAKDYVFRIRHSSGEYLAREDSTFVSVGMISTQVNSNAVVLVSRDDRRFEHAYWSIRKDGPQKRVDGEIWWFQWTSTGFLQLENCLACTQGEANLGARYWGDGLKVHPGIEIGLLVPGTHDIFTRGAATWYPVVSSD